MNGMDALMRIAPVIPVLVVRDLTRARPIAEALVAGGLPVLEVTLRTPIALDVIREMSRVPGAIVGAGTVLNDVDLARSIVAGARFVVSPGLTRSLCEAVVCADIPFLPGISSAGDLMRGISMGFDRFKLFPAEAAGGLPMLRALAAPFGDARFCPTGGITAVTAAEWLKEPSVLCVGGSWLIADGEPDVGAIRAAAALPRSER